MKKFLIALLACILIIPATPLLGRNPLAPDTVLQGSKNEIQRGATLTINGFLVNPVNGLFTNSGTFVNNGVITGTAGSIQNTTFVNPTVSGTLSGNYVRSGTTSNEVLSSATLVIPVISGTSVTVPNSIVLSGSSLRFIDSGTVAHTLTYTTP